MKNNIGYFEAVWLFIWNFIKNSVTYKVLRRIYDCISNGWRNSAIGELFRRVHFAEDVIEKSIAGRVVRSPFTFIEFLQRKYGKRLSIAFEKSLFLNICRTYLSNIMAINLRFIGVTTVFAAAGILAVQVVGGGVSAVVIAVAAAGLVISLFDTNVTEYFKGSALVTLVCNLLGIEPDFNWFDKRYTRGRARLITGAVAGLVFGIVGGVITPILVPLAIIGVAAGLLLMDKPAFGVFLIVFAAPLVPTMAAVGLALICIFSMLVHAITTEGFRFKFDGVGFFVIVFITIYLIGAITSFAPLKSLSIWAIYFVFMAVYFAIINSVNSKKMLTNLVTTFVISGFLVCLYGIMQYLFGWDTAQAWMDEEMFEDIKMRIYSTLGNPNVLGEYILLVLPAAIGLMWTSKKACAKIVYAGISALMFGALILTFSRGCWIGIMVAAAIFITFAAGKLWGLGLIALPVIPMVLPESIINRFSSIGDMKDSSTSYRVYIWMGTLAMMRDFWISGIGMGQEAFTQVYPFYSYNGIVAPHSHNLFLQILVETGVTGIATFAIIIFLFLRKIMTGYTIGGKGDKLSTLMTAITAGICGFLVQGMFDNCFYNYRVMLVFWCTIAIARACVYVAEQGRTEK